MGNCFGNPHWFLGECPIPLLGKSRGAGRKVSMSRLDSWLPVLRSDSDDLFTVQWTKDRKPKPRPVARTHSDPVLTSISTKGSSSEKGGEKDGLRKCSNSASKIGGRLESKDLQGADPSEQELLLPAFPRSHSSVECGSSDGDYYYGRVLLKGFTNEGKGGHHHVDETLIYTKTDAKADADTPQGISESPKDKIDEMRGNDAAVLILDSPETKKDDDYEPSMISSQSSSRKSPSSAVSLISFLDL